MVIWIALITFLSSLHNIILNSFRLVLVLWSLFILLNYDIGKRESLLVGNRLHNTKTTQNVFNIILWRLLLSDTFLGLYNRDPNTGCVLVFKSKVVLFQMPFEFRTGIKMTLNKTASSLNTCVEYKPYYLYILLLPYNTS